MTCGPPESPDSTITAGDVLHEFKRYAWPSADFIIEPEADFILVNRNTAARAPDNGPVTKNITLLGEPVTLEATPDTWTWHWGDGSTHITDHPGQPHPHATIHHTWTRADTTAARVDITYTGRYRINNGPWAPLPGTHTVRGPATTLDVIQAAVQLIR